MTSDQLRQHVHRRNTIQILVGGLALGLSPLLWLFSFWVFQYLFWFATYWFLGEDAVTVSFWIAVLGMVVLVFEGVREGWELFSLEDLADRPHVGLFVPGGLAYYGNLNAYSYVITHVLFCAPRITLIGMRALQSLIRPGPLTIDLGVKVYNDLAERGEWVAVDEYAGGVGAATLLRRLGLVWIDDEKFPVQVRIPPGEV